MKTIAVIGAMDVEVRTLKERITQKEVERIASMEFCRGTYYGKPVVIVQSGVGKVNAAICTQILADRFGASAVINTGIAGSLRAEIDIGDIVISKDAVQHDVDAGVFGYRPGQIPQMDLWSFPVDGYLQRLAWSSCVRVNPDIHVHLGRILSGDQFISEDEKKEQLVRDFDGYCTEMEGAAIAQAAAANQIPCVILRAISDKADHSAQVEYDVFEAQAAGHCINLVDEMLKNIELS